MATDEIDDEYVANLLKKDAKVAAKKYKLVGLDAFDLKSSRAGAPKPNTRFLRHIIRQTDSHNAALLAKEAEESRARLAKMNHSEDARRERDNDRRARRSDSRTPYLSDDDDRHRKRRRIHDSGDDRRRQHTRRRDHGDERREHRSRRDGDRERRWRYSDNEHDERSRRDLERPKRHRDSERRPDHGEERDRHRHRTERPRRRERTRSRERYKRTCSRSRSRTRTASPRSHSYHNSSRHRRRSHSPRRSTLDRDTSQGRETSTVRSKDVNERAPSPSSGSDALDELVGPLPSGSKNIVRPRGRGANKVNSMAMDARFSSTYNASADVRLDSGEEDEWGDSLEALRDRQIWKAKGADRLREAGFSDDVVKKWEKGEQMGDEDVVWGSKGQDREWDRGKVVDEEGNVDTKAEWGKLK